jgi:4-amino-4-deoxy-L-arabinose transferase-like glycosyltransferase
MTRKKTPGRLAHVRSSKPKLRDQGFETPAASPAARWHWPVALATIFGIALSLRLIYLYELSDTPLFDVLIGDSLQYDTWAQRIAAGDWIGTEIFYQSPLYPYLLAVFYRLVDHDVFAVRVGQAMLGAVSCVLLSAAGRRFFDAPAGLIAGFLLAIYPPAIFFDGLIQKSSLDLFLTTLLLAALGASFGQSKRTALVLAGLSLGALALNRENARVLYPVVAAWLALRAASDGWKERGFRVAIFTAAMAAVLLPVALRNLQVGGEFLLTTAQSGPNFYIGNGHAATGAYEPLVPGRGNALYEREDATRLAEAATGRSLSPGEVSGYWWNKAIQEITDSPRRWLILLARKAWLTVAAAEPVDTESIEAYTGHSGVLGFLQWLTFGFVMALAAVGVVVTRAEWRRLWILYAMFATLALSVVMFYVFARYRYPLASFAALFAGAGLARLRSLFAQPRSQWVPVLATALILGILLHIPVRTSSDETYVNYGSELMRLGRPADAVPLLEQASRVNPDDPATRLTLALALQQAQQPQRAIDELRTAIRLDPASASAHVGLAIALHQQGDVNAAIPLYQEAIRLKPDYVEAISNLALAFQRIGEREKALAQFRLAASSAREPRQVMDAEYALAQALLDAGQSTDAIASLERALAAARAAGQSGPAATIEQALAMVRARR